ncbi:Pentapeptide_repeats-containing protein [Hexamita inflata]|uniref:Pentapeptide repeats-containing protein n=1 Tax=Hexamita inflata TaxID=28002 RepID=A0AA86RA09_9EUKA|nr:Pentapeptide repeats-containing protein [Hexamita inflata]
MGICCSSNENTSPQKRIDVDVKQNTMIISDDDTSDLEVAKLVKNLTNGLSEGDVNKYMEAVVKLQDILSGNLIKCNNPVKHFADIMLYLSGTDAQGIDAWKKREIAEVAEKMIHRVYLSNKEKGILVAKATKEDWLEKISITENLINNKLIHQNGLEFELDCMRAGINVLSQSKHDIKDQVVSLITQIIKASISAVKGDYSGLIVLGKDMLKLLINYCGDKRNEIWYLKVMAMSYTYGLSAINQEMLGQVIQIVNQSIKSDWHVCYAGLHSISKAIDANKLNLTEAINTIEKFAQLEHITHCWRLREKVAQICIEQAANKQYGDRFAKILLNLQIKEKNSEVKKTLQNPEYIKQVKERLQKVWKFNQASEEAMLKKQQEQLIKIQQQLNTAISNNDQESVQRYQLQFAEQQQQQKQTVDSLKELSSILGVQIYFIDDISKQMSLLTSASPSNFDSLAVQSQVQKTVSAWSDDLSNYRPVQCSTNQAPQLDLYNEVQNFIKSGGSQMLVQGQKQSGKSTFCKYLTQELLKQGIVPVYVDLNTCRNKTNIIQETLNEMDVDIDEFKNVQFLLIIDGYEKMNELVDVYKANHFEEWKCQVLFTCQSEFLENKDYQKYFAGEGDLKEVQIMM